MLNYREMQLSGQFRGGDTKVYAQIKQCRETAVREYVARIEANGARLVDGSETAWVSAAGEVFSTSRRRFTALRPGTKPGGYKFVHIHINGGYRYLMVHRLVALAFVANPNPGVLIEVNHLDGNKANNHAENLEWCTRKQNALHAVKKGLIKSGSRHSLSKLSDSAVRSIRAATGKYRDIGATFGVSAQTVCNIKRRSKYWDVS